MSDDLWGEYKATEFWVEDQGERFCIMVDKRSLELDRVLTLHRVESWAYVTAHNPRSQVLIPEDNALRHQQLLDRIVRDGYSVLQGRGIGSDPDWIPEDSYLILGIPRTGSRGRKRVATKWSYRIPPGLFFLFKAVTSRI